MGCVLPACQLCVLWWPSDVSTSGEGSSSEQVSSDDHQQGGRGWARARSGPGGPMSGEGWGSEGDDLYSEIQCIMELPVVHAKLISASNEASIRKRNAEKLNDKVKNKNR